MQQLQYEKLSDEVLIDRLMQTPTDNKLHDYFFNKKCNHFLLYISNNLYNLDTTHHLIGEFYEYISNENWKVLRLWKKKNNCKLSSYLATCTTRYFTEKVKAEKQRAEIEKVHDTLESIECADSSSCEDNHNEKIARAAFNMLKERDQQVLRLMIIENNDALSTAPLIWKYINSGENYKNLTTKKIQNTMSMIKHRALVAMFNNFKKLSAN